MLVIGFDRFSRSVVYVQCRSTTVSNSRSRAVVVHVLHVGAMGNGEDMPPWKIIIVAVIRTFFMVNAVVFLLYFFYRNFFYLDRCVNLLWFFKNLESVIVCKIFIICVVGPKVVVKTKRRTVKNMSNGSRPRDSHKLKSFFSSNYFVTPEYYPIDVYGSTIDCLVKAVMYSIRGTPSVVLPDFLPANGM